MKYRKILIAGALLLMFTLGACAADTGNAAATSSTAESHEQTTTASETPGTSQTSASENDDADITITVEGSNYSFSPDKITVKKGQKVKIVLDIKQGTHDWVVDVFNAATEIKSAGTTTSVVFVADKTGSFEFYCSVGNHRTLGMVGTLIVE
jgi:cytochrome c oxidase subunit 2